MKTKAVTFSFLLILLSGCFHAYYPQTGSKTYNPTQAEYIEIYTGEPEQEYIVMGSIAADVISNSDAALNHLKKRAAQIGADAIINLQVTSNLGCGGTGVSGVAVKMKLKADYAENIKIINQ